MIKTNKSMCFLLILLGVFFSILKTGNCLTCYECNSHDNKMCAEKNPPRNLTKECRNDHGTFVACRKITQTIDFEVNGLPPDSRVIRACAYQQQEIDKCYQRSGFGGRQEVCACAGDFCNNSNTNTFSFGLIIMTSGLVTYSLRSLVIL